MRKDEMQQTLAGIVTRKHVFSVASSTMAASASGRGRFRWTGAVSSTPRRSQTPFRWDGSAPKARRLRWHLTNSSQAALWRAGSASEPYCRAPPQATRPKFDIEDAEAIAREILVYPDHPPAGKRRQDGRD